MNEEINDPIAALRSELARVAPSPGFAERVRERLADDLEPLRAELTDLAVSPEFAVRVRQSIEAAGNRRGFSWPAFNWRLVVPAAGLAAAAVVAFAYFTTVDAPAPVQIAAVPQATPIAEPPKVAPAAPVRQALPEATRAIQAPRVARAASRPPAPVRQPRDPMLEVITDQPAILRALWVRVGPGVTVDSTEPTGTYQAPKLEVAPIEVSPISKFVVPDTRAPIGVTPFILRVTAESAERSSR